MFDKITKPVSPETLQHIVHEVQWNYDTPIGNCQRVSKGVKTLIERHTSVSASVVKLVVGSEMANHYVATIPMECYTEDTDTGRLLIDGTLTQFATKFKQRNVVTVTLGTVEEIPNVALYTPGAEERYNWYGNPNDETIKGELDLTPPEHPSENKQLTRWV